ncbi:MAG: glycosyltransferase, partial [Gemmataceae bacterium]
DGTCPGPAFADEPIAAISYYFYAEVARNVTAPGPGFFAFRRECYRQVGGWDARRFPEVFYPIDLCLRFAEAGWRTVHLGGVEFQRLAGTTAAVPAPTERLAFCEQFGRPHDRFHPLFCSESMAFRPALPQQYALPSPAAPLNALVMAHNLNSPEGAPRYLSEIVLGLHQQKYLKPRIVSPRGGAGEKVYDAASVPVTLLNAPYSDRWIDGHWTPAEYESVLQDLKLLLKATRPEVVIANTLLTFPIIEAAARLGVPTVWIIHESYSPTHLARLFPAYAIHRIERAFALASRVVPASHDTAALFAHLNSRQNQQVIHNGLRPDFAPALPHSQREEFRAKRGVASGIVSFLAVGTVCERKGQHQLVEAARLLAESRRDFLCEIVGFRSNVPYGAYVQELVTRYGLNDVVRCVPETDRVPEYLASADVFVCTSFMETYSRAILEAEAYGLPILSTPCCGIREQVVWGHNALPVTMQDPKSLAEA